MKVAVDYLVLALRVASLPIILVGILIIVGNVNPDDYWKAKMTGVAYLTLGITGLRASRIAIIILAPLSIFLFLTSVYILITTEEFSGRSVMGTWQGMTFALVISLGLAIGCYGGIKSWKSRPWL